MALVVIAVSTVRPELMSSYNKSKCLNQNVVVCSVLMLNVCCRFKYCRAKIVDIKQLKELL